MKVTVTALKAGWPAGVVVGSVVDIAGDSIPSWAVNKCTEAPAGAEAQFTWPPVEEKAAAPAAPVKAQGKATPAPTAAPAPSPTPAPAG